MQSAAGIMSVKTTTLLNKTMTLKMHPFYDDKNVISAMQKAFSSSGRPKSVILYDVLTKESLFLLIRQIQKKKTKRMLQYLTGCFSHATVPVFLCTALVLSAEHIIKKKLTLQSAELLVFGTSDYIIANDRTKEKPGIDLILDVTDTWDDSFGGHITYVDGSGDGLVLPAKKNMFVIVERKKDQQRVVTYVNHHARKKKHSFLLLRCQELPF